MSREKFDDINRLIWTRFSALAYGIMGSCIEHNATSTSRRYSIQGLDLVQLARLVTHTVKECGCLQSLHKVLDILHYPILKG